MKLIEELRQLTIEELEIKLLALRKDQFNLRMKKSSGSLEKSHLINRVRKSVAKVKTILTEKAGK